MSLSFKKRIASHFMLATAIITALAFGTVYLIVQKTVYKNLDNDLTYEAHKHKTEINIDGKVHFFKKNEWEESEHKEVQVNPVFLQLNDENGYLLDKSPNLKERKLVMSNQRFVEDHYNTNLNKRAIRQIQIPLLKERKVKAYIVAAMSLDGSILVLENLRNTLFVLFPIVLLLLYLSSSFLAGKSIKPVVSIINTANRISKKNLDDRVPLPPNKDELYDLSSSINRLLDRIEKAIQREKQFTSDASHELRTPLSVLRGTLEVLIRKPRNVDEYEAKIKYSLFEIDRMANILEQLLEIARFDANPELTKQSFLPILVLSQQIITRLSTETTIKNIQIKVIKDDLYKDTLVDGFYGNLIIENLLSNAIKYSHPNTKIEVQFSNLASETVCTIKDYGIGILEEDLPKLFQPFFRSDALEHKSIKGNGLGLSIVQKAANAISAEIDVKSNIGIGSEFTIIFKGILR